MRWAINLQKKHAQMLQLTIVETDTTSRNIEALNIYPTDHDVDEGTYLNYHKARQSINVPPPTRVII
jgi:hypothetical protein